MGIPGDKDGVGFAAGLVEANEWNGFWEDTGRGAEGVADDAGAVRHCEAEWKASFARRFWSKRLAVEYQASMSSSSGRWGSALTDSSIGSEVFNLRKLPLVRFSCMKASKTPLPGHHKTPMRTLQSIARMS